MISGIESTTYTPLVKKYQEANAIQSQPIKINQPNVGVENIQRTGGIESISHTEPSNRVTFGSLIGNLVDEVDAKGKDSAAELKKVMTGEVDNVHQSMIAMQEASVAFTLMVEVRNKLMESFQQVMRMQV